ncbi:MAG: hypothetical protein KDD46_06295 [Bdellovibrionales bacterium]|nr:hypothetical protein [Bdellovibrionales bacterium]
MLHILFALLASMHAYGQDSSYLTYPTGHIDLDDVYTVLDKQRKELRKCHQDYLEKIPGAFDELHIEFQINFDGKAVLFEQKDVSAPKLVALSCMKSIIQSQIFPKPSMGIVFIGFDSDLVAYDRIDVKNNPLSRNSVTLIPYIPQKMVDAMVEMYMPYYKRCFLHASQKKRSMKISLLWTVNENGLSENIVAQSKPQESSVDQCMMSVTKEHRYPTGYAPTSVRREFNVK